MSFILGGCFYGKEKIITNLNTLKALERKNEGIHFDRHYKYLSYNGYVEHNEKLISHNDKTYRLQYFDGCFNPYCVEVVK